MFERILVPLDGSPKAEVILSLIARILRREDSEVLLLRAVDVPAAIGRVSLAELRKQEREEAQGYLHDVARRFSGSGAKVHGRVVAGTPAEAILDAAKTEGATLIAMSTHGRSGLARFALGSVTEKVARASDVPLLLVRSFRRSPKGDLEPIVPEEIPFRRILVPVDGSPTSTAVIEPARKFAQLYGSSALVLHVETPYVPPSPVLPGMEVVVPSMVPPATPSRQDDVTKKAATRFEQAGLQATRLTTVGDPASEILDLSVNRGMDLIALGTHGRSGLARWALGSVAERVLRSGEVPILLVRAPGAGKASKGSRRGKERARG
jgi:nucleotide-binding universal stress UspA family protein